MHATGLQVHGCHLHHTGNDAGLRLLLLEHEQDPLPSQRVKANACLPELWSTDLLKEVVECHKLKKDAEQLEGHFMGQSCCGTKDKVCRLYQQEGRENVQWQM